MPSTCDNATYSFSMKEVYFYGNKDIKVIKDPKISIPLFLDEENGATNPPKTKSKPNSHANFERGSKLTLFIFHPFRAIMFLLLCAVVGKRSSIKFWIANIAKCIKALRLCAQWNPSLKIIV